MGLLLDVKHSRTSWPGAPNQESIKATLDEPTADPEQAPGSHAADPELDGWSEYVGIDVKHCDA